MRDVRVSSHSRKGVPTLTWEARGRVLQSRPLLFIAGLNTQKTADGVSSRTHKNLFRLRITRRLRGPRRRSLRWSNFPVAAITT